MTNYKKFFVNILKILVTFGLLYYLFSKINLNNLLEYLSQANILLVIIAAVLYYFGVLCSVLKWQVILNHYNIKYPLKILYSNYLISGFFNNFLPTSIGGDTYRFYNLNSQTPNNKKQILSSILLERGFGFFTLFIIDFTFSLFYFQTIIQNKTLLILQSICWVIFLGIIIFIFLASRFHQRFFSLLPSIDLIKKIKNLTDVLLAFKASRPIQISFLYSIIYAFLVTFARIILFKAFNCQVDFWYIMYTSALMQIFSLIPISLNSLGVTESLGAFLYSLVNIPIEVSIAVMIIGRISAIVTSALGGIIYIFSPKSLIRKQ